MPTTPKANFIQRVLTAKKNAESSLQGVGKNIRKAWDKNSQNVENSPANKRFQAQVKRNGMVID